MTTELPEITVLMPAFNAAGYIGEAIRSVLAQTFRNFELLVVNDGSTDDTEAIVRSFVDPRIVIVNQENRGVAAALNTGLVYARAEYIARFDADDLCLPHRLDVQLAFMERHPEYQVVGSAAEYMDVHGHFLFNHEPPAFSSTQLRELGYDICPFLHSSVMFRKEAVMENGGYSEHAYLFEDHFLWRNILNEHPCANLPEVLMKVRLNPESVTIDERWRPRKFTAMKKEALRTGSITAHEGRLLQEMARKQHTPHIKYGSYYALCGKKFLINNFQPLRARAHMARAIGIHPLRLDNYLFYTLSFLPERTISWLYQLIR